ncbi:MAG TPA: ABC transporter permease subunit [Gemmatimonadaceae bacterium]|nr:ABC transporter permease subunit [Gemmatimonadaceae bacterium]
MILLVARREVVDHLRSPRFLALCALTVVLLPLSAYVNAGDWQARRAFHDALEHARLARLTADSTGDVITADGVHGRAPWGWRAGEVSTDEALRAIRAPAPLSVLAAGDATSLPAYWQFGSEGVAPGPPLAAPGSGSGSGGSGTDFVFVVQVVLGLLAVLLGGDAVCGEAESGVLRAVLANPVPRAHVVVGKYVGGMITLLVPIALGAPLALLVLRARGVPVADAWPRAVAFVVLALLYLSAMLALAIAVSTRTHRARTALVVLLVAWVVLVLVVPRAADLVAAGVHPVEPDELARRARVAAADAIEAERVDALVDLWRRVAGSDEIPSGAFPPSLKREYNAARAPVEDEMFRRKRAAFAALDGDREHATRARHAIVVAVSRASPAATFALAAAELAGTGERTRQRWLAQVRAQQRALESAAFDHVYGVELFAARMGKLRITWAPDPTDPADLPPSYTDLPRFAYVDEPVGAALRAALPDVAWLLGCNLCLLGAAVAGFVRYEVG